MISYWEDPVEAKGPPLCNGVSDLVFAIECRALPVDHAQLLLNALLTVLPWLRESGAGVHPIHGAESGNGWSRPEGPQDLVHLSRRTKLILRLPDSRLEDARKLSGSRLAFGVGEMTVGRATVRELKPIATLFSRCVRCIPWGDEAAFVESTAKRLRDQGIEPRKMLCGREIQVASDAGPFMTRSLLLAGLSPQESMALQCDGLGPDRALGCGLFIGYRDIGPVKSRDG